MRRCSRDHASSHDPVSLEWQCFWMQRLMSASLWRVAIAQACSCCFRLTDRGSAAPTICKWIGAKWLGSAANFGMRFIHQGLDAWPRAPLPSPLRGQKCRAVLRVTACVRDCGSYCKPRLGTTKRAAGGERGAFVVGADQSDGRSAFAQSQ